MNSINAPFGVINLLNEEGDKWCTSDIAARCQECIESCIRSLPQSTTIAVKDYKNCVVRTTLRVNLLYSAVDYSVVAEEKKDDWKPFDYIHYKVDGQKIIDILNKAIDEEIKSIPEIDFSDYNTPPTALHVAQLYRSEIKYGSLHSTPLKVISYANRNIDWRISQILKAAVARINKEQENTDQGLSGVLRRWSPF